MGHMDVHALNNLLKVTWPASSNRVITEMQLRTSREHACLTLHCITSTQHSTGTYQRPNMVAE